MKNNFKYMITNWKNWDKKSFVCFFIRIPTMVFQPIIMSYVPKLIIDCINEKNDIKNLILTISFFCLSLAFIMWLDPFMHELVVGGMKIIRMRYAIIAFEKNLYIPYAELESLYSREKNRRAEEFYKSYQSSCFQFSEILSQICVCIVGIIISSALIYKLNFEIILLVLTSCIIEFFLLYSIKKKEYILDDVLSKINTKFDYFYSQSKNFAASKDIRLYHFSDVFISMISKLIFECEDIVSKYSKISVSISGVRVILNLFRDTIAYVYLTYLVIKNNLYISDFIFYFGIVTGFSNWIIDLVYNSADMKKCCNDCSRYREYVESSNCIESYDKNYDEIISLEFKNVSFSYPKSDVDTIKNISFKVKKGEKIAIVGGNGAGKTTIVKLLCGLYKPSDGEILINNKKTTDFGLFSPVFQEYSFLPLNIAENVTAKKEYDENRLNGSFNKAGILEKIYSLKHKEKTHMVKDINKDAVDFSGGEAQKILLSKALYKNAPILILDEPTASLDPLAENELYLKYSELSKDKISFFISHRLSSTRFCDKIILVNNGKITEEGSHEDLMALGGEYFKMYNLQSYYYKEQVAYEQFENYV